MPGVLRLIHSRHNNTPLIKKTRKRETVITFFSPTTEKPGAERNRVAGKASKDPRRFLFNKFK